MGISTAGFSIYIISFISILTLGALGVKYFDMSAEMAALQIDNAALVLELDEAHDSIAFLNQKAAACSDELTQIENQTVQAQDETAECRAQLGQATQALGGVREELSGCQAILNDTTYRLTEMQRVYNEGHNLAAGEEQRLPVVMSAAAAARAGPRHADYATTIATVGAVVTLVLAGMAFRTWRANL